MDAAKSLSSSFFPPPVGYIIATFRIQEGRNWRCTKEQRFLRVSGFAHAQFGITAFRNQTKTTSGRTPSFVPVSVLARREEKVGVQGQLMVRQSFRHIIK